MRTGGRGKEGEEMIEAKAGSTDNTEHIDNGFSVSLCVYKNDNAEHFREALESLFNQTRKPSEIVLVVDGPIPDALNKIILSKEREPWFKVIRLPVNVGHGNARRIGLENCSYELVALMDADDICAADRFEKQFICFAKDEKISVVGGNIQEFIDSVDNVVGFRIVPQNDSEIKSFLKRRCPFNQMTVMFKRSEVEKAGGYLDWYCNEDYFLWIRMFRNKATFKNLKDCLVYVRVGKEMYQRRGGWKYFKSEAKLQGYLLNHSIINIFTYISNIAIRFILQVMMPNSVRGLVFRKFARKQTISKDNQ